MIHKLINTNIKSSHVLLTPNEVKEKLPLTKTAENTILKFRQEI
ncbi:3-deoxy-7-phosphoheptulonate synthase, partial [Dolichospermum circinale CS-545/17]|nr:3-deoxy-7-phosphoheptulonate synthase [Dolichospermum circinale CS-545/17]